MTSRKPEKQSPYDALAELYQALFERATEGIFIADGQGHFIEVNPFGCEMLGYTHEEILSLSWQDVIPTEELVHLEELRAGKTVINERWLCCKEGRLLPVEINIRQLSDGSLLIIVRDISERKQAEQKLQQANDLLRAIIEAAPVAIVGLDLDGNVQTVWNPAAEKMLGWKAAEVMGRLLPSVPVENHEEFQGFRERIRKGLTLDGVPVQRQRHDGSPIDYSIYASPLRDAEGKISGNISVLVDITERKRAEEERLAHLRFFECMDQVNRAIQGTNDLEQMMSDVLDVLLVIFECDRAWLVHPCDPEAATWQTPMERSRPEYPGVLPLGVELPLEPVGAWVFRILRAASGPVQFGPGSEHQVPAVMAQFFSVQSFIALALYPKVGLPWSFGLHQCSYPRVWTPQEQRLLQEIGRRLTDGLTSLLAYRNLQESEERYRLIAENTADTINVFDLNLKPRYISPAVLKLRGYTVEEAMVQSLDQILTPKSLQIANQVLAEHMALEAGGTADPTRAVLLELEEYSKDGSTIWAEVAASLLRDNHFKPTGILTVTRDITERKRAEEERLAHLRFFECMDQVNRAIQGTNDLEQMMRDVLGTVLSIFECDRAFLTYPCDPEAPLWYVPMECTRPEFAGAFALGLDIPMDPDAAKVCQTLLAASGPVSFGAGAEYSLPPEVAKRFGIESMLAIAVYPRVDRPYMFGLHQCSYPRVWTPQEEKLFQEIGRRLTDGLTSLLAYRNLQESELRYREVFENVSDSLFVFDVTAEGKLRLAGINPAAERLSGVSNADIHGKFLEQVARPEVITQVLSHFRRCLELGEPLHYKEEFPSLSLGRRYLDITLIPVRHNAGAISRIIAFNRDITERKQAEEALGEKTEELDRFFTLALDLLCIADLSGYFRRLNPQWEVVLGYSLPELEGQRFLDLVHPDDLTSTLATLEELGAQQTVLDFVNRYRCQDGSYRWIEWRAYPAGNLIYAAARDITEHKRAEEALRESEFFLRKSQAVAHLGSYYFDARTGHWISSPALDEIFGIDDRFSKDVNGWIELVHPEHKEEMLQHLTQHVLAEHNRFDQEYRIIRYNDQQERWMHGLGELEFDECGNPIKMIGTIQDITERKQAEDTLRESENRFSVIFNENTDLQALSSVEPDGTFRLVAINQRYRETIEYAFGVSEQGVIGKTLLELLRDVLGLGESAYNYTLNNYKHVVNSGQVIRYEEILNTPLGGVHITESVLVPIFASSNTCRYVLYSVHDITERKQVEEALRESEFFLRKSQSVGHIGSYYLDARTGQWISSPGLDEIFGIDDRFPKDVDGWIALVHPEQKEELLHYLSQYVLAKHNRFDKEYRIIRHDNQQERWMHGLGELEFDENGNPIKMIGTIQDITERKLVEEALQLTRFTMESVADAVYWINSEARIIEVNKAACDMLGYTHEELCGLLITDIDPVLPMAQWPHLWELIQTTGRNMIESMHRTKTGRLIPVEIIANFIKFGDQELDCAVVRDITERKQVEAQLRTSEAHYRALVESQVDLISRYLPDTTLTFVNDAYCQFYGKKREELIGLSFLTMVAPEFHEITLKETESLVKEPQSIAGEYLNYTWDGQSRWIHWIIQSIVDENGQVIELQASGRDITPLKQAEDEIHKLNKKLEQRVIERTAQLEAANRELEAFAYSVSHDLRAPLRHIDGFLELLETRIAPTLDERSRHYMTTISASAKRMGQLIDDLLSFSRMGRNEMSKTPVELQLLVQEVIQQLEPEIQDRTISWHIADLPLVNGDRAMLRIVLVNLITNAIKFTRGRSPAEIEIGCQPGQGSETIFFVRDNGAGFDMDYADKLFGVFQRLHRIDEFEGTGIGLANVRRIIQRHGGRTWAEGKVDQGATFFFSLPQSIQGV